MSSKRGKLAERRAAVGQSSTPITVETTHLTRVPATVLDAPEDVVAFWIPVRDIQGSPFQYRYYLDGTHLQALMESIAARELYQPITVRPLEAGAYEVVLGHRRLEAFRRLGREAIPAIVREYNDAQVVRALLDENLKRADVNLFEQTEGVVRLLALELELQGEMVSAVRRVLEEMRSVKRSDQEVDAELHLKAARLIEDVTGMSWESFLLNRLSVYRLSAELQEKVRRGMPYSLAVAVGRLEHALQAEALDFLEVNAGEWRSREEFRAWLQKRQAAPQHSGVQQRLKRLLKVADQKNLTPMDAQRVAALLDQLEKVLK